MKTDFKVQNRTQEAADEELGKLYDELVPPMGKADTKAGEIVRAMNRLVYRWYNDGDMVGCGYGKVTCNAAARYLVEKLSQKSQMIYGLWGYNTDDVYEVMLLELSNYVIDYILANPQLKEVANEENYLDWRDDEEDVDDEEENDELF